MRVFLFLLVLVPAIASAQINRSAFELARENVRDYLVTKIFKNQSYKPGSYSELKSYTERNSDAFWMIEHEFEIAETRTVDDTNTVTRKPYKFVFYLNRKMSVIKALAVYLE